MQQRLVLRSRYRRNTHWLQFRFSAAFSSSWAPFCPAYLDHLASEPWLPRSSWRRRRRLGDRQALLGQVPGAVSVSAANETIWMSSSIDWAAGRTKARKTETSRIFNLRCGFRGAWLRAGEVGVSRRFSRSVGRVFYANGEVFRGLSERALWIGSPDANEFL